MNTPEKKPCLVCFAIASRTRFNTTTEGLRQEIIRYECPRCGIYDCSDLFEEDAGTDGVRYLGGKDRRKRADLSGWLRERADNRERRSIRESQATLQASFYFPKESDELRYEFEAAGTPTFHEKADKLLLAVKEETSHAGQNFRFSNDSEEALKWHARSWSLNKQEFSEIVGYLVATWRIDSEPTLVQTSLKIIPDGWARIAELESTSQASKQGFVAMWFGDEVEDLYTKALAPAIRAAGYAPLRIDKKPTSERIDDRIEVEIKRSRFVIADVTAHRTGVYFEAGFARGLKIPVIWTCREDSFKERHFDTMQFHHEIWTEEAYDQLAEKLRWRIENICGRGPVKYGDDN